MWTVDRRRFGLGLAASLGAGTLGAPRPARAAKWRPRWPIEFVIMAGEGDGADRLARRIIGIIEKHQLVDQPITPVNMGGQSGGQALSYLKDNAGNPNIIMATLNSLYTTPLRMPSLGVDIAQLTPVVNLAIDSFMLWVNAESGIKTIDDYIRAARRGGAAGWTMGGTGRGQEDSLVTAMLEQAYVIRHAYKSFKGGGDVAESLIAKEVDATVNNPAEQIDFYLEGKSRPLAAFTPRRLAAFPEVPTFRELGHDLVYHMQRGVMAPAGIPKGARAFYERLFWDVVGTEEWRSYAEQKSLVRHWLKRGMLRDFILSQREQHRRLLLSIGEIA